MKKVFLSFLMVSLMITGCESTEKQNTKTLVPLLTIGGESYTVEKQNTDLRPTRRDRGETVSGEEEKMDEARIRGNWVKLHKGMSFIEVMRLLGPLDGFHYNIIGNVSYGWVDNRVCMMVFDKEGLANWSLRNSGDSNDPNSAQKPK